MMQEPLENRWLRFGLATNPYFPEPLSPTVQGPRPITLFQGRKRATKDLLDTLASEQNSLVLIEGAAGVGKSTFVNHAKYQVRDRYVAPVPEISVSSSATAEGLLLGVLDAVVRHASDLQPHAAWEKDYPAIHRARRIVLSLESVGWNLSLGLSVPGGAGVSAGAGASSMSTPPVAGPFLTTRLFDELTQDLLTLRDPPFEGVIFHVNNLDTLMRESVASVERLFSDLREHFQVPHTHWWFLGPPGLQAETIAGNRRMLPFVKARIELDQLPIGDVHALLKARYEHYAIRKPWTMPSTTGLVDHLYDKFGGDLRGTIDALSKAHSAYRPVDVAPLDEPAALAVLEAFYRARLEGELRQKTKEILDHLIKLGRPRFTQDDAQAVEEYQGNRSTRFAELEAVDAVRFVGNDGRRKLYAFGGAARLAYGV